MKKNTLIIIIGLFICNPLFSQEKMSCYEYISASEKAYYAKDYKLALDLFQQGLNNKCENDFRQNDFYNAACSASLNQDEKLTFVYLNKAVEKGYENIEHMTKDADLDFVRNSKKYQEVINKIRVVDKEAFTFLKNIKKEDIDFAIPYIKDGKWGWLHRTTLKPLSKAIFDYTDFKTNKGLLFIYKGRKRYYTGIQEDVTIKDNNSYPSPEPPAPSINHFGFDDAPMLVDQARYEPNKEEKAIKPQIGFTTKNGEIINFADQYKRVELISEGYPSMRRAIATNHEGKKGIIYENGDIVSIFDFNYVAIDYFLANYKPPYFVVRKSEADGAWIYDEKGNIVHNEAIDKMVDFDPFQRTPLNDDIFIGTRCYQKYLGVYKKDKGFNILKKEDDFKPIFSTHYDSFIFVNGPTYEDNKNNKVGHELSEIFFWVKKGDKTFYVDENGKEYQVKK